MLHPSESGRNYYQGQPIESLLEKKLYVQLQPLVEPKELYHQSLKKTGGLKS